MTVLMKPAASAVLPVEVKTQSNVTRDIRLNIPVLSAAMDTVTDARLAIAMAQSGGMGVIHRNMEPDEQAEQVRQVKRFESGMVINPGDNPAGRNTRRRARLESEPQYFRYPSGLRNQTMDGLENSLALSPIVTFALPPTRLSLFQS